MDRIKSFISYQWKNGGFPVKIIAINILLYVVYAGISFPLGRTAAAEPIDNFFNLVFVAEASFDGILEKPWTIVTHLFMHASFFHLFFNMLLLFFAKEQFQPIFGEKRFIWVYFIGGIFGFLLETFAYEALKGVLYTSSHGIVGASGAVMAILIAVISYIPKQKIRLFGVISIPMYVLGIIMLAGDFIGLFSQDGVAHFSHIGGGIIGFLAGFKGTSSKNVFNSVANLFKRKPKVKANKPPRNDYDYASKKRDEEDEINKILEKIKKSGYDSLSKKEKERLFKASNK